MATTEFNLTVKVTATTKQQTWKLKPKFGNVKRVRNSLSI
jgi:hypothetical protein